MRARPKARRTRSRASPPRGFAAIERVCACAYSCGPPIAGNLRTLGPILAEDGQRPPGPAGISDERIFEIQPHDVPAKRREGLDHPTLLVAEIDDDEF